MYLQLLVMSRNYRINEFAKRVGRATSTVRRWEREGKLTAKRLPSGQRYDRLVRFGFDLLNHISRENGCEIVVVNQESLSPEQEMVEDLLAIVHTFSYRLKFCSRAPPAQLSVMRLQLGGERRVNEVRINPGLLSFALIRSSWE